MGVRLVNPSTPTTVFIDTNVLLYGASDGSIDPEKKRRAQELIETRPFVVSMQVVQEKGDGSARTRSGSAGRHEGRLCPGSPAIERAGFLPFMNGRGAGGGGRRCRNALRS